MAETPRNAIEVRGLVKCYGDHKAVDGLDLDVRRGELLSLLGPNGAGKSTTLRILSTLMPPTGGSVVIRGHRVPQENASIKPLLGLVPQEIALYDMLTARHNLKFFARLYGMRGAALDRKVDNLLEEIGLADRGDQPVRTFSGGMQRRVNIAAALVHDPEIVFLDEPTVGLDPVSRSAIWKVLDELRARGKTLVLTTHYMEEAQALSDRVAIVDHGKVIAVGTTGELVRSADIQTVLQVAVAGEAEPWLAPLRALGGVHDVRAADGRLRLTVDSGNRLLPQVVKVLAGGVEIRSIEVLAPDLGAVFLHYTGRELRD